VRAVSSLDIENFFGSFQDIDPRGSGVLRPDDIPSAISVAVELLDAKLNPNRFVKLFFCFQIGPDCKIVKVNYQSQQQIYS